MAFISVQKFSKIDDSKQQTFSENMAICIDLPFVNVIHWSREKNELIGLLGCGFFCLSYIAGIRLSHVTSFFVQGSMIISTTRKKI